MAHVAAPDRRKPDIDVEELHRPLRFGRRARPAGRVTGTVAASASASGSMTVVRIKAYKHTSLEAFQRGSRSPRQCMLATRGIRLRNLVVPRRALAA